MWSFETGAQAIHAIFLVKELYKLESARRTALGVI
jgi:hypothetical protein